MPGCVGDGVATPLLGVVVVGVGRVVLEVVGRRVVAVGRRVVAGPVLLVVAVVGTGSHCASTQYECPAGSVPQFAGMEGF